MDQISINEWKEKRINEAVLKIKPFKDVKVGDVAITHGDKQQLKVVKKGTVKSLASYSTGWVDLDDPTDMEANYMVKMSDDAVVLDTDGETEVYAYSKTGAYVLK